MKRTTLDNPEIQVRDERIVELDKIVAEVKESEGWEEVQMNILEVGISRGIQQGEERKLLRLVCKKLAKGCSVPEIAEMLEEDEAKIRKICDVAAPYAPDYEQEAVWQAYQKEF